jgi:3-dehydroquinate dehydratase
MQPLHRPLSLQAKHTLAGSTTVDKILTIRSTAAGIDFPIPQAKRLTDMEAMSENCGEYIRLEFVVFI